MRYCLTRFIFLLLLCLSQWTIAEPSMKLTLTQPKDSAGDKAENTPANSDAIWLPCGFGKDKDGKLLTELSAIKIELEYTPEDRSGDRSNVYVFLTNGDDVFWFVKDIVGISELNGAFITQVDKNIVTMTQAINAVPPPPYHNIGLPAFESPIKETLLGGDIIFSGITDHQGNSVPGLKHGIWQLYAIVADAEFEEALFPGVAEVPETPGACTIAQFNFSEADCIAAGGVYTAPIAAVPGLTTEYTSIDNPAAWAAWDVATIIVGKGWYDGTSTDTCK